MKYLSLFSAVLGLVLHVRSLSPTHLACQLQKPAKVSPLLGCSEGTIFVSATDSRAKFTTVQDAVLSLYVRSVPCLRTAHALCSRSYVAVDTTFPGSQELASSTLDFWQLPCGVGDVLFAFTIFHKTY